MGWEGEVWVGGRRRGGRRLGGPDGCGSGIGGGIVFFAGFLGVRGLLRRRKRHLRCLRSLGRGRGRGRSRRLRLVLRARL